MVPIESHYSSCLLRCTHKPTQRLAPTLIIGQPLIHQSPHAYVIPAKNTIYMKRRLNTNTRIPDWRIYYFLEKESFSKS